MEVLAQLVSLNGYQKVSTRFLTLANILYAKYFVLI